MGSEVVEYVVDHLRVSTAMIDLSKQIKDQFDGKETLKIYPIPIGGIPVSYLLKAFLADKFYVVPSKYVSGYTQPDMVTDGGWPIHKYMTDIIRTSSAAKAKRIVQEARPECTVLRPRLLKANGSEK